MAMLVVLEAEVRNCESTLLGVVPLQLTIKATITSTEDLHTETRGVTRWFHIPSNSFNSFSYMPIP